ncbi:MAG UNVERIFIED_CONTAM: hypothetical protein LVR29_17565 [Microcystis novacekii LVE1205-3]
MHWSDFQTSFFNFFRGNGDHDPYNRKPQNLNRWSMNVKRSPLSRGSVSLMPSLLLHRLINGERTIFKLTEQCDLSSRVVTSRVRSLMPSLLLHRLIDGNAPSLS